MQYPVNIPTAQEVLVNLLLLVKADKVAANMTGERAALLVNYETAIGQSIRDISTALLQDKRPEFSQWGTVRNAISEYREKLLGRGGFYSCAILDSLTKFEKPHIISPFESRALEFLSRPYSDG